jgi:hypothetical protein
MATIATEKPPDEGRYSVGTTAGLTIKTDKAEKKPEVVSNIIYVDFVAKKLPEATKAGSTENILVYPSVSGKSVSRSTEHSRAFLQAMRPYFLSDMLTGLKAVQKYAGTPKAAVYIDQILTAKVKMEEVIGEDSIMPTIRAFYDAIACDGRWLDYSAEQYQKVFDILEPLSKLYPVSSGETERAVMALEDAGFDTTPFALEETEVNSID